MKPNTRAEDPQDAAARLGAWLLRHPRCLVLTGAGCSTGSGIPDYRDRDGAWKRPQPIQFQDFMDHSATRQRYWARSLIGWQWFSRARPNTAHLALAQLESGGWITHLITQNVDRLHQRAGQQASTDLHGRIDRIRCMRCDRIGSRAGFQRLLLESNPGYAQLSAGIAPDGDADLAALDFSDFEIPACHRCGGIIKPDVVFFGEAVPAERVRQALRTVDEADALLVVGSSLMVYSGYRFCRRAHELGRPIAALNQGRTRADDLLALKLQTDCGATLNAAVRHLAMVATRPPTAPAPRPSA